MKRVSALNIINDADNNVITDHIQTICMYI